MLAHVDLLRHLRFQIHHLILQVPDSNGLSRAALGDPTRHRHHLEGPQRPWHLLHVVLHAICHSRVIDLLAGLFGTYCVQFVTHAWS